MSITFRPSLTLDEINYILSQLPKEDIDNPYGSARRKLEVFTLKAKHGITRASHVRAGTPSKAAQLGFEDDTSMDNLLAAYNDPIQRSALSAAQLQRIQYHRYMEDMMTPEEEKAYEATQ